MRSSRFIFHTAFHPLLLEQTDFLVGQSRHDSPEGLKKVVGAGGKGAYVRDALAENRPPVNEDSSPAW